MKKTFFLLVVIFLALALAPSAHAMSYDFDTGLDGFLKYGSAHYVPQYARLTTTAGYQRGSIFLDTPYDATIFEASFDFYIVPERKPRFFLSAAPGAIFIQSTYSILITFLS